MGLVLACIINLLSLRPFYVDEITKFSKAVYS